MRRFIVVLAAFAGLVGPSAPAPAGDLASRVRIRTLTLPHTLEPSSFNWCTWGSCSVGPRLYQARKADGTLLVGWTDSSGNGHVSSVVFGALVTTHDFAGNRVKGLVAHEPGYAVLLWNSGTDTMRLSRRNADGSEAWGTGLNSTIAVFDNDIGDSRLSFGGSAYAAYYAVFGTSGPFTGHNGDQLKFVNASGSVVAGGWDWGCSHSMSALVGYHPGLSAFTALCSSDCFPQKGLNADDSSLLVASDGNCTGLVSLQLGQMAAGGSTWKIAFNAMDTVCCDAHGIGFASMSSSYATTVAWLTATDGANERDPVLARLGDQASVERYLTGWRTANDAGFHLAVVDGSGALLEGPLAVAPAGISWGNRDDSFRGDGAGTVTWVSGAASSTTLRVFRFVDDLLFADGFD